nr:RecName: Full=Major urinary protein 2; Short=MUP 2 [Rattus norvegicus]
NNVDKLNGDW